MFVRHDACSWTGLSWEHPFFTWHWQKNSNHHQGHQKAHVKIHEETKEGTAEDSTDLEPDSKKTQLEPQELFSIFKITEK